jgi:hypothetical protein
MSDVLTNLIARSATPADAVRPLAASLYAADSPILELEAQQRAPAVAEPLRRADQPIPAAPRLASERPRAEPVSGYERTIDAPATAHPPAAIGPALAPPAAPALRSDAAIELAAIDRLVQRALAGLPAPQPAHERTIVERLERVHELQPPPIDLATPMIAPAAVPPLPPSLPHAQPAPSAAAASIERLIERTTEVVTPPPRPAAESQPVAPTLPLVTPLLPALPALPDQPRARVVEVVRETTAAPAAPTIQVSIGRIEVRAQPAAQPSRSASPRSAVMSLDEYLRRREGGSR